jgi:anti-anti-sigma factor
MMVQPLSENCSVGEGILSIELEGPVDLMAVPRLRKRLLATVRKNEVNEIHIDFSRVTLLDTSGVAMLVEIWRSLAGRNGVVRLTGLGENARRLIHLARLDQIFAIKDDRQGKI